MSLSSTSRPGQAADSSFVTASTTDLAVSATSDEMYSDLTEFRRAGGGGFILVRQLLPPLPLGKGHRRMPAFDDSTGKNIAKIMDKTATLISSRNDHAVVCVI